MIQPTCGSIKSRLAAGKRVNVFSIGAIPSPKLVELAALVGGYHAIWIDEEHAAVSQQDIEWLAMACRAVGIDSYVRLAPLSYAAVMRPLEAGCGGIMAAQVRGVEEVRQVVSWFKYPPLGQRGLNLSNVEADYGTVPMKDHVERANDDRWLSVQIETLEALDCVDAIAAVDGVDHLFVGPADLSVSLGVPGEFLHPKCVAALERVSAAVSSAGKSWGILARGIEHATVCQDLGCRLFAYGNELAVIIAGLRAQKSQYNGVFDRE